MEIELHAFLTSALYGGERLASRPGRFTPRKRSPSTHSIGAWVDFRAVLEEMVKRKNTWDVPSSNLGGVTGCSA